MQNLQKFESFYKNSNAVRITLEEELKISDHIIAQATKKTSVTNHRYKTIVN